MIWRLYCWWLNICPECENTYMYWTKHFPISKCRLAAKEKNERI